MQVAKKGFPVSPTFLRFNHQLDTPFLKNIANGPNFPCDQTARQIATGEFFKNPPLMANQPTLPPNVPPQK